MKPLEAERVLRDCVEYCRQQNSMDECKNCGLTDVMIDDAVNSSRVWGYEAGYKEGALDLTMRLETSFNEWFQNGTVPVEDWAKGAFKKKDI